MKEKEQAIDELLEFKKWGDTFTRVAHNPKTDVFVYKRTSKDGRIVCIEVVKPRLRHGMRCYPSSEEFGRYGVCLHDTERDWARIENFLQNGL